MASDDIRSFLQEIDAYLASTAGAEEHVDFHLLGRSALILGYGFGLSTKDVDVVQVHGSDLLARALAEFGRDTPGHRRLGFFLEDVSSGLPPLPQGYQNRCKPIDGDWRVIRPSYPDIHDLAATKLSRFEARDRQDIMSLADTGEMDIERLKSSVESSAFLGEPDDEDSPKRKRVFENLKKVIAYLEGTTTTL